MGLPVLMKAQGKCTTDHISAAGKWLTYRGHLENISGNLFLGAVNAFNGAVGEGKSALDGSTQTYPDLAKQYGDAGMKWCAIGDRNYGEGSSREHAAMEPRFRGGVVIFARSFARIHETNLKKQGLVPLTFADPGTYDLIGEDDTINVSTCRPSPVSTSTARSSSPTARRSTSRACTRSAPNRSSGSRPVRRSTSCAGRLPKAQPDGGSRRVARHRLAAGVHERSRTRRRRRVDPRRRPFRPERRQPPAVAGGRGQRSGVAPRARRPDAAGVG